MQKVKPRIGLFLFQSQWFKDVGLTGRGSGGAVAESLSDLVAANASEMGKLLQGQADLVATEPIATEEQACVAALKFLNEQVDVVLVCPLVWSEDQPLLNALPLLGDLPLLLWCYSPYRQPPARETLVSYLRNSGIVGALQFVGALKKWQRPFEFVLGSLRDVTTLERIMKLAQAAAIPKRLRGMKIGLLPSRCDQMTDIFVDEGLLKERLGLVVKNISVAELQAKMRQVSEGELNEFVNCLKSRYCIHDADGESIRESARVSLGMKKVAEDYRLGALSVNESERRAEQRRCVGTAGCLEKRGESFDRRPLLCPLPAGRGYSRAHLAA